MGAIFLQFYISSLSGDNVQPSTRSTQSSTLLRCSRPSAYPSLPSPHSSFSSSQFSRSHPYQPGTHLVISLSLSFPRSFLQSTQLWSVKRWNLEALGKYLIRAYLWDREVEKKKNLLHAIGREIEGGYLRWNVNVDFNYSGERERRGITLSLLLFNGQD